ncbi:MAG TPA: hypothetical protein VGR00_01715, partial [Thermoanaerobaculia bacterium]|nr:hypothetical protein [Thermoanaerobaculia bacterium]
MSAQPALPRLFGPYVLTRLLSSDALGDVYRAGTAAGKGMRPFLLIRMFNGEAIDRTALQPAMETAVEYLEEIKGPAVAKGAVLGVVDDIPFAGVEYVPGRTLDLLLAGQTGQGVPLPPEHALLITEKLLIALEAARPLAKGAGAPHGFLTPGFVSVSNDGDVRVFGTGLGPGLLSTLKNPKAKKTLGPYVAPEIVASGKPTVTGDIYSAAAILFEGLTGKPPAPGAGPDAMNGAVLSTNGNPIPDDIKSLLVRGLTLEPARRASDVVAYRKELGKLLYGGPYAPSTFNLAFFIHHEFEKSIDRERKELNIEEQLDPTPLLKAEEEAAKAPAPAPVAAPRPAPVDVTIPKFGIDTSHGQTLGGTPMKKGPPIPAIAAGVVLVLAAAGYFLFKGSPPPKPAPPTPVPLPTVVPTAAPPPTPQIVGKEDPAFQAALAEKLKEEENKIKEKIQKEQDTAAKKRQADLDRAADESRKAKDAEAASAAARQRADQEEAARLAREAQEARQREEAARAAAAAVLPKTNEGDLVDVSQVDEAPRAVKIVKPEVTPMAIQRHVSGTVMMRVLVDQTGHPAEIET